MKLLLVRHGESTWNVEGRYQGWRDPSLSHRGVRQAEVVAKRLALEHPRAVASSPLLRARQTAEAIAKTCALETVHDKRLMEISHGDWEGLTSGEIARSWPAMLAEWKSNPQLVCFPRGESLADVAARWHSFLSDAVRMSDPLVIVTHDVIIRLAYLNARGELMASFTSCATDNGAITEMEFDEGRLYCRKFNETSHLGDLKADLTRQAL